MLSEDYFEPADEEHIKREKNKARELRASKWWKNKRGQGICHYCGRQTHPSNLTMDHITPVVRGGRSTKNNIVPCCEECNARKQSKTPVEWQEYLELLRRNSR